MIPQPLLFFALLIGYKLVKRTRVRTIGDMSDVWFVKDSAGEDAGDAPNRRRGRKQKQNRFYAFLSWVK